MKKSWLFIPAILLFAFIASDKTITDEERKSATSLLQETEDGVFSAVKGLGDAQLKFKPSPETWSVEECLKHIAISEQMLRNRLDKALKEAANPDKRAGIKVTDEQLVKGVENRSRRVKTVDPLKPENTGFKSAEDALNSFKENRDKLIEFVKSTQEDLRNHVIESPFGPLDSYQWILFIGGHSNRHTQQIEEVKANPNFPRN